LKAVLEGPTQRRVQKFLMGASSHNDRNCWCGVKECGPRQAKEVEGMTPSFTPPAETSADNAITPSKSMTAHPELKSLQ